MRAEIIAIGSELLLGQSIDTNGPWIASKLTTIGIDCHFKSIVGDNINNIVDTFTLALSRADVILCTGGLGPTQDDITKDALAKALQMPLIYDESLAEKIREKFASRQRPMSENNLRQAYYPQGAQILSEHPGTAPGIYYKTKNNKHIFLMPGVPTEMELMMTNSVLPILLSLLPSPERIYTSTIKCWGLPESDVAEKLSEINDELDTKSNPKLSFLASGIEGIQVRFSSKNSNEEDALALIEPYKKRAINILGHYVFGFNNDTIETSIQRLLEEKNLSIGIYETFSEGLIAYRINELVDNPSFFKGSLVHNKNEHNNIKCQLVQVHDLLQSNITLSVQAGEVENRNITLTLYLLYKGELQSKDIVMTYFNHEQTVKFSVINLLNMLRLFLQRL